MDVRRLLCCGLQEISGLSQIGHNFTPRAALLGVFHEVAPNCNIETKIRNFRSGVIFTGAGPNRNEPPAYAVEFAAYIERENLGTVFLIPKLFRNKNSGNYISTYVWIVKPRNLAAWYRRNS